MLFYRPVLFQDFCHQMMTNPLVLVAWCSGAQQSRAAIVTIWNLLGEQKPKAQQKTSQNHAFCLSFFSWRCEEGHQFTVNVWVYLCEYTSCIPSLILGHHCLKYYCSPPKTCMSLLPLDGLLLGPPFLKWVILHCSVFSEIWWSPKGVTSISKTFGIFFLDWDWIKYQQVSVLDSLVLFPNLHH